MQCRASTYFFDLDGTLTDSSAGLFASFRAGLDAIGGPALSDAALGRYLGTPLPILLRETCPGIERRDIRTGMDAFRAYYEREGITANRLYDGVSEMLGRLRELGRQAVVVTSKPQHHAERVVSMLGLDALVDGVIGAGLEETDTKTELVARALAYADADPDRTIMLGDRRYDIVGALDNRVTPVGAQWGYGSWAELWEAGCRLFCRDAGEFAHRFVVPATHAAAALANA